MASTAPATSLAASTSLADAEPPIALGALDGRYRGVVAPLVDHLSEPALNRARVHVEVEWLIHLTEHEVVPGVRRLTTAGFTVTTPDGVVVPVEGGVRI